MADRQLNDRQRDAVYRYSDHLAEAAMAARKFLTEGGIDPEPHFECLMCDCDGFTVNPLTFKCRTPGCGHAFFQHNLPR